MTARSGAVGSVLHEVPAGRQMRHIPGTRNLCRRRALSFLTKKRSSHEGYYPLAHGRADLRDHFAVYFRIPLIDQWRRPTSSPDQAVAGDKLRQRLARNITCFLRGN